MSALNDINVSLEPHLLDSLKEIYPILPKDLKESFSPYMSSESRREHIPYTLLLDLSKWTRTSGFSEAAHGIGSSSYAMVCLLAGTTTSPERKLGDYVPPPDPEEVEKHRKNERKAIAALVNAVLSVGGVGAGAWWASARTGWRDEWRVLFSMFAAIVVAVAEAGLYLIYLWRIDREKDPKLLLRKSSAEHKKYDSTPDDAGEDLTDNFHVFALNNSDESTANELRQRK